MVYLAEIRKRLVYVGLSFLSAWLCAYTQRVPLMYYITLSLQQVAPSHTGKVGFLHTLGMHNPELKGREKSCSAFLENIVDKPLDQSLSNFPEIGSQASSNSSLGGDGVVRLIFTDVQEAFYTLLSVSLFWCILACIPVLVYHILCFLQPGFYAWQSVRAWFSVCTRLVLVYVILKLVDLIVIPQLLLFFYSFQIKHSSLCLDAETKVVSYVYLYVLVYCITVILLLFTGVWSFYRQRKILHLLSVARLSMKVVSDDASRPNTALSNRQLNISVKGHPCKEYKNKLFAKSALKLAQGSWGGKYKYQRSKTWWGCLLLAALISPPEVSSQLVCAFLLIVWSEIGIWLAYTWSCRLYTRTFFDLAC